MKRRWKIVLTVLGTATVSLLLIALAIEAFFDAAFSVECQNRLISEHLSPDRSMKVVVFERGCGATVAFSTQLSLVPAADGLLGEAGNLFVADFPYRSQPPGAFPAPDLEVWWGDRDHLVVHHQPWAQVFKAETSVGGVAIRHVDGGISPFRQFYE